MVEVLSQGEITELLKAINQAPTEPDDFKPAPGSRLIKIYDFKRPDKFSREHIRSISIIHESFSRLSTTSLSGTLRSIVHVHVASVDSLTYEEFIRSIPTPTTLGIIQMSPLKGCAVLEIDPAISFSIIDRLMGGNGIGTKSQHELTFIETDLMKEIIHDLLDNLQKSWSPVIDLKPKLYEIDTNPQFAQIVPPTEMVVLVTLETKVGDVEGMINLCIPYPTLEPIMDNLTSAHFYGAYQLNELKKYHLSKREEIPVKLTAELFKRNYSIQEISDWNTNATLIFPARPMSQSSCFLKLGEKYVWRCEILKDKKLFPKSIKILGTINTPFGAEEVENMEKGIMNALSSAKIAITVELGTTYQSVVNVFGIGEGTILELDKLAGEPMDVKANGVLVAKGEAIVVDENFGVRITEVIASDIFDAKAKTES